MQRSKGEGFERVVAPLLDALHRTACRLTRNEAAAEDLVQETLLKGLRFFHSFEAGTNFKAWIFRVLYTVFVTMAREKRRPGIELDLAPELASPDQLLDELERPSPAERESAVLEAVDDQVKSAIEELPTELRAVFMLSTIEQLKYREIAEVVGCPLGTVMSRLFRSRRMLQDRLSAYARERGFKGAVREAGRDAP